MKNFILISTFILSSVVVAGPKNEVIQIKTSPLVTNSQNPLIHHFNTHYKKGNRFIPIWVDYTGSSKEDYISGFDSALKLALYRFPNMGMNAGLKDIIANLKEKPQHYKIGFFAGLEVYSSAQLKK